MGELFGVDVSTINSQISRDFFAEVQNKFLYAVSHNTAPELISSRINAKEPNMGLTSWKGQKTGGKIVKTDITIGKNYLSEEEIEIIIHNLLNYTHSSKSCVSG